jgi:hypothetical protein
MSFKTQYTTSDLILSEASMKPEELPKDNLEKDKVVLSNDAYAIGQLLECAINKMGQ